MPPPPRNDPYTRQHFRVEIDGLTAGAFSECSGITAETSVIEYGTGSAPGSPHKIPGMHKFSNITLKRGITKDRQLWDWYKSVLNGAPLRKNGSIILLDEAGQEVLRWNFHQGWPAKYEAPCLDASSNDVAIETIEIAHEGLELA